MMNTNMQSIKQTIARMYPGSIIGEPRAYQESLSSNDRLGERFNDMTIDDDGIMKRIFYGDLNFAALENSSDACEGYAQVHQNTATNDLSNGLTFKTVSTSDNMVGLNGYHKDVFVSYVDFVSGDLTLQLSGWLIPISLHKRGYINHVYQLTFGNVADTASVQSFFPISANNLSANLVLTVTGTDAADFQLSTDGISWTDTLTLTKDAMGHIKERNIQVLFTADGTGSKSASISCTSDGTETETITMSATVV